MYYVIYEQRLTQTVLNSVLACVSSLACVGVLGRGVSCADEEKDW